MRTGYIVSCWPARSAPLEPHATPIISETPYQVFSVAADSERLAIGRVKEYLTKTGTEHIDGYVFSLQHAWLIDE